MTRNNQDHETKRGVMNLLNNQDILGEGNVIVNKKRITLVIVSSYCSRGYVEPRNGRRERRRNPYQYVDWGYAEATWSLRGSSDDVASRAVWSQPLKGGKGDETIESKATGLHKQRKLTLERRGKLQYVVGLTRVYN